MLSALAAGLSEGEKDGGECPMTWNRRTSRRTPESTAHDSRMRNKKYCFYNEREN